MQHVQARGAVAAHGLKHVRGLVGDGLQRRADDVRPARAAREADDGAAAVHVPVRRAQSGEGRHEVDVAVVSDGGSQRLGFRGRGDQAHLVAQPLDHRPGHEHAALQCVARLPVELPGNGGDQIADGLDRVQPRVHQQKTAGAVGVFRHSRSKAAVAKQRRLLVAHQRCHGDLPPKHALVEHADHAGGVHHLGQHLRGDVHGAQKHLVPAMLVDVVEHGAGGVGGVGHVRMPGAETIGQKAVHRAKAQFALFGAGARIRHRVQQPLQFGAGKVGVGDQPRAVAHDVAQPIALESLDERRGAAALPDDGVVEGLLRLALPQKRGLALAGDAHGRDVLEGHAAFFHRRARGVHLALQYVLRAVFHPAGLGVELGKFDAVRGHRRALFVKKHRAGAGRPLIERQNVLHAPFPPLMRTPKMRFPRVPTTSMSSNTAGEPSMLPSRSQMLMMFPVRPS